MPWQAITKPGKMSRNNVQCFPSKPTKKTLLHEAITLSLANKHSTSSAGASPWQQRRIQSVRCEDLAASACKCWRICPAHLACCSVRPDHKGNYNVQAGYLIDKFLRLQFDVESDWENTLCIWMPVLEKVFQLSGEFC